MERKIIEEILQLEKLAEESGGYVLNTNELKVDKQSQEQFTALRKYCVANKKRYDELNKNDFKIIGIKYKKVCEPNNVE